MKTAKRIIIAVVAVTIVTITVQLTNPCVKKMRTSLQESTHEGYRSMVADYVF